MGGILSSGVGVFHVKGWGPKSSGKPNLLAGDPGTLAGMSRGARKVCEKKIVFNLWPLFIEVRSLPDYSSNLCPLKTFSI